MTQCEVLRRAREPRVLPFDAGLHFDALERLLDFRLPRARAGRIQLDVWVHDSDGARTMASLLQRPADKPAWRHQESGPPPPAHCGLHPRAVTAMGKGKKDSINPADAYRKEQKKKEIKKNKKERQQTRELTTILRDPSKLSEEVKKLEKEVRSNPIDNQLRQRLGQFRGHLAVLMKKQRDEERELQARREELEPSPGASSSAPAAAKPVVEQRNVYSDVAMGAPAYDSTFVPKPPSGRKWCSALEAFRDSATSDLAFHS